MKRFIVLIMIVGMSMTLTVQGGVIDVPYTDDFEDGASGWDYVTAITPTSEATTPVWTVGSGILSQTTAAPDVSRPQAMALAPVGIVDNPHITVDVRCDSAGKYEDVGLVFAYKPAAGEADDIFYVDMAYDRIFAAIGNINTTPTPASNRFVLNTYVAPAKDLYVPQTWAKLDVILDSAAGNLVVKVNDVEQLNITSTELVGISGRVGVCSVNDNVSFDNFSVVSVPEPATMCLLGLGSLVCLRRRRK